MNGSVVGIGLQPGTAAEQILAALQDVLGDRPIHCLATFDRRANEPGLQDAAAILGVPVLGYTAEQLAAVPVPTPNERVQHATGTASVAEAAALMASGQDRLMVPKTVAQGVTIAVATR